MLFLNDLTVWFLLLFIKQTSGVPFNQPKFCPNASWNPNAITFANNTIVGSDPWHIFITTSNTIYVPNQSNMHMIVWSGISSTPIRNISLNSTELINVFVTERGDVYFGYTRNSIYGIGRWTSNSSNAVSVMEICPRCYDVFVDISDYIYCSMDSGHQVIRKLSNNEVDPVNIVAGTGIPGSAANTLNRPNGLFVDTNFDLYVADCFNNRIQLFQKEQSNGITVAGTGSFIPTINLNGPTGIVLDANKYLFIVEYWNHRIVGNGPNGFRCLVGCNGSGSVANQLNNPRSVSFDMFGNLFVADSGNSRIQKFILMTNSCNETTASPPNNVTYPSTNASNIFASNTTNGISYNQPKLDPHAVWSPNAITLADSGIVGSSPFGIFINKNNTIYVATRSINRIPIWTSGSVNPTTTIDTKSISLGSIFVTSNGHIYTGNLNSPFEINKWTSNTNDSAVAARTNGLCHGIFVDINNTLYFSDRNQHKVLAKSLSSTSNILTIVAGTGGFGNAANMLNWPHGIFVDVDFHLYVADTNNHRIQLFRSRQLNAITVAGSGSTNITITLNRPASVVLDADKYLFIADYENHRIVGSGPYGFRCIVGCTGLSNSIPSTLSYPTTMAFDSFGNIYVTDADNNRIQKFVLLNNSLALSYNQPKLCPNATWNPNATPFADNNIIGSGPYALFIDTNNTIYGINRNKGQILIWLHGSIAPSITLYGNLSSLSIFATINGDIYVDNGLRNRQVEKFTSESNASVSVLSIPTGACFGLFVDISNSLYCSVDSVHQVFKKWLVDNMTTAVVVAGTGSTGSAANLLNAPNGIFVDTNFDLYVADYGNHRIQRFQLGSLKGITVAGNGSLNITITLYQPTNVLLDGNKYLFVSDTGNNRIIGSDKNGFRCIVGCSGSPGPTSNKLENPRSIAFDSYGHLVVVDRNNSRIQKFMLLSNLCSDATTTTAAPATTDIHKEYTTSPISMISQKCYSPKVTLIPGGSTLSNPLQFRRSQDFYIVSMIEFKCNDSLSMQTQWMIKKCTNNNCSSQIQLDSAVPTTFGELYIPSRTLVYGVYELQILVSMTKYPWLTTLVSVYVQITPSGITANLVQLGTSMITSGHQQALQLDPGTYSVDPDEVNFNSTNWVYKYYCRIYGSSMFPNLHGYLLTIDDPRADPPNPSCLSNRTGFKFGTSINSSLTILSNSLQSNRTYQFMVQMENVQNSSRQATGYVLVKVEDARPQMIAIGCVILTMCSPNLEYQLVNPTTQVALFSFCVGNCSLIQNITWKIYSGQMNTSTNSSRWTLFNQTKSGENIWFFGSKTSNFTSTNQLFLSHPQVILWRFEVVYSFASQISTSALNFVLNQPPVNGSCSVFPSNGTTSTLFTITCPDWVDEDGVKDYSFYAWTTDKPQKMMIAFSGTSPLRVQLPPGDNQTGTLYLMAYVRDQLNCVVECNLSTVTVFPDFAAMNDLISSLQSSPSQLIHNPVVQLLASGNPNIIGQVITSVSQQLNRMNMESIDKAVSSGIPVASISVSSLGGDRLSSSAGQPNQSALIELNKEINSQANVREYLISFVPDLVIRTSNSIILQSSTLSQLTAATNQLTRTTLTRAAERCFQLALALSSISTRIAYEDIRTASTQLIQCASNVLNAVNSPLQQRSSVLNSDSTRATAFPTDYDTDLESEWSKLHRLGDENVYYQSQLANQIENQMNEILSKLTSALNVHLNVGQEATMNTSQTFMSLETQSIQSLANKQIKQVENAGIYLPSTLQTNISTNERVSIQSMIQLLAPFGNSKSSTNTNLSRSVSLSVVDQHGNQVSIKANDTQPIEIIIPRDPNLILSPMVLQNVTSTNSTPHHQLFYFHYVNITTTLSISVHFELHPLNTSLAYLLIYKFDQLPQLNSSISQMDGWTILCPSNLSNDSIYTYFLDNQQTQNHQSLVFGLRELHSTESALYCSSSTISGPPITNRRYSFTSNYELRIYTCGCYYLDENNQWGDQGLRVGSLTNYHQTQCFSTHLTTFAGGFVVLPEPVNWQYVFAHADFMRNKTVYLTVICISTIYFVLVIYARCKDEKDLKKLGVTPLPDHHQLNGYYDEILVFTGHRQDSGTKSRVQRCTCCFILFLLSTFLNIMYYNLSADAKTSNSTDSFRLGPLILSREQTGVGVIVELLALIPSVLLVQIFRRLRSRGQPKKKTKFTLPWWFVFPACGLCLVSAGVSMSFIIVGGIELGDLRSEQWLTSILTGFFPSIFVTQSLKIISLSVFFACVCGKPNEDQQARDYLIELNENEEYLHSIMPKKSCSIQSLVIQSNRLSEDEVMSARQKRFKDIEMWSFLRKTVVSLTFICLLFAMTYSHQTVHSSIRVQRLQNDVLHERQSNVDCSRISTVDELWEWSDESFVGNVRVQQWYNGDEPGNLSGYINDKSNRLIGRAMMRQLRMGSQPCPDRRWNWTCSEGVTLSNEETNSFELGWTNVTLRRSNRTLAEAFEYQSKDDFDSYSVAGDHVSLGTKNMLL